MEEITAALVKNLLPRRRQDGHKGSFGRVYVYGGSVGYTGAPVARKIADQYFFGGIRTETVTPPGVLLP